ncbi:MAG: dihydrofolate reductase family protein [Bacteroidales bacterium]|nr:dihydrofolate reductase family protein [Bacteroidales bacterium]MDT8373261.1 dihydrofolate reductase family protein [Bacteroidales bacterium]
MKPFIILHNSVTLDGSLTGFLPDMELHYRLAGSFQPDANLIGSETVITGQEMFGNGILNEEPGDFVTPVRDRRLPWWVIVDSGGRLKGMLHTCRRFEYCKDVILLVSELTPEDYIKHLVERKYRYICTGGEKVDLQAALSVLSKKYGVNRIVTDTGSILGNLLLDKQLVDEVSVLVHPMIKGIDSYNMFCNIPSEVQLSLIKEEKFDNGCVWIVYKTKYNDTRLS